MSYNFSNLSRDPYEPIAAFVQRTLRRAIISRKLEPGEMLSEQEIARQFGISRQPVREAFIKLSEVGLLRVLPQRGTQVAKISLQEVTDARFVRQAVEAAVVAEAARHFKPEDAVLLDRHLEQQEAAAAIGNREAFFFLDEAFHADLAHIAQRPAAWRFLENVKSQMDRVRFLAVELSSPLLLIIEQHHAIAAAIKSGDAARATLSMDQHLSSILSELPQLRTQYANLFTDED